MNVIGNRQITAQTITHTENGILRTKSIGGPLNTNNNSVSSTVIIALYMDINTNLNFGNTLNNGTSGSYNSYINISKL